MWVKNLLDGRGQGFCEEADKQVQDVRWDMKRKPDLRELQRFIKQHYRSKKDFRKALGISQSHLYGILNGRVELGNKVLERLNRECDKFSFNTEDLLKPEPMNISGMNVDEILITRGKELIVSITSRNVIEKTGYKAELVPYRE